MRRGRAAHALWLMSALIACGDASAPTPGDDASRDMTTPDSAPDAGLGDMPEEDLIDASIDLPQDQEADLGEEMGEDMPVSAPLGRAGGAATTPRDGATPFANLIALDIESLAAVSRGRELFVADWEVAPSARAVLDGLGPLHHASSCLACHPTEGRAPSLLPGGAVGIGLLLRLAAPNAEGALGPSARYGEQLQPRGIAGVPGEASVRWAGESVTRDGVTLTRPVWRLDALAYGPIELDVRFGPRLSPQLAGLGLLELVPEEALVALSDPDDLDGDGVSGRVSWLLAPGAQTPQVGRFGWKASQVSLRAQSAAALRGDMGLTTTRHPQDDCTVGQAACRDAPSGGAPEVEDLALDDMALYLSALGVPARGEVSEAGLRVMREVGCTACHADTLMTSEQALFAPLAGQLIHPFTDLLLHDMGEGLADGVAEGVASAREWRTPPLWGVGLIAARPDARFLHDGRATSLHEAILWHGGEASGARERYVALDDEAREALLEFLRAL